MEELSYLSIFEELKRKMIEIYDEQLKPSLYYHNSNHTLDVLEVAEDIAIREGITDPGQLFILKTAALFHDSGFLYVYEDHESKSCEIMRAELENYDIPLDVRDKIARLIMMTKIPPDPEELLDKIICDSDLDYLGREDFFEISELLKKELQNLGMIKDECDWQKKQLRFFESHTFYTKTSQGRRETTKNKIYQLLKERYAAGNPS